MRKQMFEALDSVGKAPVSIRLNDSLFPQELVADCARKVPGVSVAEHCVIIDGPNPQALASLRDFCAELISAKLALL